jgi:hypothetical protein
MSVKGIWQVASGECEAQSYIWGLIGAITDLQKAEVVVGGCKQRRKTIMFLLLRGQ